LWADKLEDTKGNKLHGKTEFDPRRIILNKEQTIKETVSTAVHEWFHGLDHDHEMGLTEDQILKLEKAYPYMRELVLTLEGITKRDKGKK